MEDFRLQHLFQEHAMLIFLILCIDTPSKKSGDPDLKKFKYRIKTNF